MSEIYNGGLGDKATQHAWMAYADANDIPHDHEEETPFKYGFNAFNQKRLERLESLEVVAAALYLGHNDAKAQFDMYKAVYLDGSDPVRFGNLITQVTRAANAIEQAADIRTAAEALVAALTKEADDYDGLVEYAHAKELHDLQAALSRGWLARQEDARR